MMIVWRLETQEGKGVFQKCSGNPALEKHMGAEYPSPWEANAGHVCAPEWRFGCPTKECFRYWFDKATRRALVGSGVGLSIYRAEHVEVIKGRQCAFRIETAERLHWFELK